MAKKKAAKGAKTVKTKPNKSKIASAGKSVAKKKKVIGHAVKIASKVVTKKAVPPKGFNKGELEHFRVIILEKRKQIIEELDS